MGKTMKNGISFTCLKCNKFNEAKPSVITPEILTKDSCLTTEDFYNYIHVMITYNNYCTNCLANYYVGTTIERVKI